MHTSFPRGTAPHSFRHLSRSFFLAALIASAFAICGVAQTPPAIADLDRARQLLNSDKWKDAEPLVKEYLAKHPDTAEAHALMGLVQYREHQPKASMAEYVQASQMGDLTAFDLRIFALDCAAIPDLPEAEKWMLRSIDLDGNDAATWEALGHVRFAMQHYDPAIEALNKALTLKPRTVSAETLMALANERLARLDAAEADYRTAISWQNESTKKDPVPLIGLGRVLIANNRPQDAIEWLVQATHTATPPPEAHELLGLAYSKTGNLPDAVTELKDAIAAEPKNARLHLMLSKIYRSLGQSDNAAAELKQYSALQGSAAQ